MNYAEVPELKKLVESKNMELLPCPFCGGSGSIDNTHTDHYWVACDDCEAEVPAPNESVDRDNVERHKMSIESAVSAWNQRFHF